MIQVFAKIQIKPHALTTLACGEIARDLDRVVKGTIHFNHQAEQALRGDGFL